MLLLWFTDYLEMHMVNTSVFMNPTKPEVPQSRITIATVIFLLSIALILVFVFAVRKHRRFALTLGTLILSGMSLILLQNEISFYLLGMSIESYSPEVAFYIYSVLVTFTLSVLSGIYLIVDRFWIKKRCFRALRVILNRRRRILYFRHGKILRLRSG